MENENVPYNQDRIRWYVKISWVLHSTASVLAVGVAFSYWTFLCTPFFGGHDGNATRSNTTGGDCQPLPLNLHLHGVNAIIAILDIWMSRIPFQLCHFFYTTPFTTFYLIFSVIYWVANGRTEKGVIYPILDYGAPDKTMAVAFAMALIFLPMLIYLVLFGIAFLRDVTFRLLRKVFFWDFNPTNKFVRFDHDVDRII